jgi:hypothetical protein
MLVSPRSEAFSDGQGNVDTAMAVSAARPLKIRWAIRFTSKPLLVQLFTCGCCDSGADAGPASAPFHPILRRQTVNRCGQQSGDTPDMRAKVLRSTTSASRGKAPSVESSTIPALLSPILRAGITQIQPASPRIRPIRLRTGQIRCGFGQA